MSADFEIVGSITTVRSLESDFDVIGKDCKLSDSELKLAWKL